MGLQNFQKSYKLQKKVKKRWHRLMNAKERVKANSL